MYHPLTTIIFSCLPVASVAAVAAAAFLQPSCYAIHFLQQSHSLNSTVVVDSVDGAYGDSGWQVI
jgi:hypothetical protein